jgi:hypothetical protein
LFIACQGRNVHGGGSFTEEYAAFHIDLATRGPRLEEAVEILRRLSSEGHVSYQGTYNQFSDVTVLPRPVQQPIPIWVVADFNLAKPALQERAMRRVARYGDGWMTAVGTPETVAAARPSAVQPSGKRPGALTLPLPGCRCGTGWAVLPRRSGDPSGERSEEQDWPHPLWPRLRTLFHQLVTDFESAKKWRGGSRLFLREARDTCKNHS